MVLNVFMQYLDTSVRTKFVLPASRTDTSCHQLLNTGLSTV